MIAGLDRVFFGCNIRCYDAVDNALLLSASVFIDFNIRKIRRRIRHQVLSVISSSVRSLPGRMFGDKGLSRLYVALMALSLWSCWNSCWSQSSGPILVLQSQMRTATHAALSENGIIGVISDAKNSQTTIFQFETGRAIRSISSGGVVAVSQDGSAAVIGTLTGEITVWSSQNPGQHSTFLASEFYGIRGVAITNNAVTLYIATFDGYVIRVDAATQKIIWRQKIAGNIGEGKVTLRVTESQAHVAVFTQTHSYLLQASNGEKQELPDYRKLYDAWQRASASHNVIYFVIDKKFERLFFIANDAKFYGIICIEAKTGRELWRKSSDTSMLGLAADRLLYFLDYPEGLKILDAANGESVPIRRQYAANALPVKRFDLVATTARGIAGSDSGPIALWDMASGGVLCSTSACGRANSFSPFVDVYKDLINFKNCHNQYAVSPTAPAMTVVACNGHLVEVGLNPPALSLVYEPPSKSKFQFIISLAYAQDGRVLGVITKLNDDGKVVNALVLYKVGNKKPYARINLGKTNAVMGFGKSSRFAWVMTFMDIYGAPTPEYLRIDLRAGKVLQRRYLSQLDPGNFLSVRPESTNGAQMSYVNYGSSPIKSIIWSPEEDPDETHEITLPLKSGAYTRPAAISYAGDFAAYSDSADNLYFYDIAKKVLVWQKPLSSIFGISEKPENIAISFSKVRDDLFIKIHGRSFRISSPHTDAKILEYVGVGAANGPISENDDGSKLFVPTTSGIEIFDARSASRLGTLHLLGDGGWLSVAADNRFDAGDLESLTAANWIMADDPLEPLPVEVFMRDYFEPQVLTKIFSGKKSPEIPSLEKLNRARPSVKIVSVEKEKPSHIAAEEEFETVKITVEVAGESRDFGSKPQRRMTTGVYDLRLFRDGQLVGQYPPLSVDNTTQASNKEEEVNQWIKDRRIVDYVEGKGRSKKVEFSGIRLPRLPDKEKIEFSAYAFNVQRVKSDTDRFVYELPKNLKTRAPRAYVVTIGVNAFEDKRWNLKYAANDARRAGYELKRQLAAVQAFGGGNLYEKVVWIPLISDEPEHSRAHRLNSLPANKTQIEVVIKILSGQPANTQALAGLESTRDLRRANPEDLVIFVVSTHGIVDESGKFYFLPADIGRDFSTQNDLDAKAKANMLSRTVSSDELAQWLQGLDAIDQVMIVDACHSAATVENTEFKPGPMGSQGLGQLAYDKGMRVLASTQVQQQAIDGTDQTRMGLLIYALIEEGLRAGKADAIPKDRRIMLSELLNYASQRVPGIFQGLQNGTLKGTKGTIEYSTDKLIDAVTRARLQQPTLFDFAKGRDLPIGVMNQH